MNSIYAGFPVLDGGLVQQGHVDYCAEHGHATYVVDGTAAPYCPRCGENLPECGTSIPAQIVNHGSREPIAVDELPIAHGRDRYDFGIDNGQLWERVAEGRIRGEVYPTALAEQRADNFRDYGMNELDVERESLVPDLLVTSGWVACQITRPGTLGYQRCVRPEGHRGQHKSQDDTRYSTNDWNIR